MPIVSHNWEGIFTTLVTWDEVRKYNAQKMDIKEIKLEWSEYKKTVKADYMSLSECRKYGFWKKNLVDNNISKVYLNGKEYYSRQEIIKFL